MKLAVRKLFALRTYMPRSLYGRTFVIIGAPLLCLQLVMSYFFLDRHVDSVTKLLAQAITSEISVASDIYEMEPHEASLLSAPNKRLLSELNINLQFLPELTLNELDSAKERLKHPFVDEILKESLEATLDRPFLFWTDKDRIYVAVQLPKGILNVSLPHKRLLSKTTSLVLFGTFGASALFLIIALAFMRNQVRPIQKLAEVSEKFGKGQDVLFRPQGSLEVRKAAHAFIKMKDRIQRHMSQRRDFLASISHDLRTPLTRMKLELALMDPTEGRKNLEHDICEMEEMIREYLAFVQGDNGEESVLGDVVEVVAQCIDNEQRRGGNISFGSGKPPDPIKFFFKTRGLQRCIANILSNAGRYAPRAIVSIEKSSAQIIIHCDDNGAGISEQEREDVFKPFYRVEASRNQVTGGIGLGLSIARDIARAHGGEIFLRDSKLGGLRVSILLPI